VSPVWTVAMSTAKSSDDLTSRTNEEDSVQPHVGPGFDQEDSVQPHDNPGFDEQTPDAVVNIGSDYDESQRVNNL
jgi:hypothetical protein